jgi:tetratricopeptide (TPR) repeat protein
MKKNTAKTPPKKNAAFEDIPYESVRISLRAGRHAEAEEQILRILSKWPAHLSALNDLGVLHALRGEQEDALKRFIAATQNDNTDRIAIHNLLGSLMQMGRRDDAIATLQAAMESATGPDIVDIAELYRGVLSDGEEIPGPLFHFMKPASPPKSPQKNPVVEDIAIMGRIACLGKDVLQLIKLGGSGRIELYNQQKGRVDLFLIS